MFRNRSLWKAVAFGIVMLAAGAAAPGQTQLPRHLSGTISDYTPLIATLSPTGPWEMRGHWSLQVKGNSGKADFSAFMTMELSDSGVAASGKSVTDSTARSPHTHHILMTDASVSTEPADLSNCPAFSPANTPKFVVTGPANFISGNGNPATFEKLGPTTLQICISGGTDGTSEVTYSNMSLVMTGPGADKHFGPQPIHGAVRSPYASEDADKDKDKDRR